MSSTQRSPKKVDGPEVWLGLVVPCEASGLVTDPSGSLQIVLPTLRVLVDVEVLVAVVSEMDPVTFVKDHKLLVLASGPL